MHDLAHREPLAVLAGRLRAYADDADAHGKPWAPISPATLREAADAIDRLRSVIGGTSPRAWPLVFGVSRVWDSPKGLLISFERRLADDELRALHDFLKELPCAPAGH